MTFAVSFQKFIKNLFLKKVGWNLKKNNFWHDFRFSESIIIVYNCNVKKNILKVTFIPHVMEAETKHPKQKYGFLRKFRQIQKEKTYRVNNESIFDH